MRARHTVVPADSATLSDQPALHIGESWLVQHADEATPVQRTRQKIDTSHELSLVCEILYFLARKSLQVGSELERERMIEPKRKRKRIFPHASAADSRVILTFVQGGLRSRQIELNQTETVPHQHAKKTQERLERDRRGFLSS